jgi:Zn-dependent metalloprotease
VTVPTSPRPSLPCILPPHLLESLARNGRAHEQEWARHTLEHDARVRGDRQARRPAVRPPAPPQATDGGTTAARRICTAAHGTELPGAAVRREGQGPVGDAAVDEAYDGLGATYDLYRNVYGRNSIDDAGMPLLGTVHYDRDYDNAFWDGSQMVFGDGDGTYFNRFTVAVDVIGHELTHGVTGHLANLEYSGQPGALNESLSDVFGSLVKQYAADPTQTAGEADWLIGAGLFTARVHGVAIRSMKAPGTAYDDPVLGKDPQPADMAHYVTTSSDDHGVHLNSGIPNRAFYLAAIGLGGRAWEGAGRIWYATVSDGRLRATATFADFANLTVDRAGAIFDAAAAVIVADAWRQVGVEVTAAAKAGG